MIHQLPRMITHKMLISYCLLTHAGVVLIATIQAAFNFHTGRIRQAVQLMRCMSLGRLFALERERMGSWWEYVQVVPGY